MTEPDPRNILDCWDQLWAGYDPAVDDPTRPRICGSIAADALARLDRIHDDLWQASRGVMVASHAARLVGLPSGLYLREQAMAASALCTFVPDAVRDLASKLPIAGIDYQPGES
ncbi:MULTISPECIES: hypothetical protein [Mycolicibacterium]|jgi:hypothetical protein|uniref:hypothetical protein n=1 Tax=Mycolicibacterium TaxID=1866885 RepID=UPI00298CE5FD|nr:hypothetical protein [Mycolicibacterium sp. D5.8-2]MDW5610011.1 hypothetical protein [Mycolicibacterium sp. D5.8-2]